MSVNSEFCTLLGITSGWCAQYMPQTPPAFAYPAGPQTSTQMTLPGAWTPDDSELATQAATVGGAQQFLQNVPTPGAVAPCDWTAAVWTDPTTYCSGNWLIVGLGVVGIAAAFMASRGRR